MPEHINHSEFQDLPPWARDIRDALHAYNLADSEARGELGSTFMDGREGKLRAEYTQRAEKFLYEFLAMEDKTKLPEQVVLEKITTPQQHLSIGTNIGGINLASPKPHVKYFLPREEAVYEVDYTENRNPEFDPEKENFVGFIKVETYAGNYSQPSDPNKLRTPLGINKHQCKETDPWNWRLTLSEICTVTNLLKEHNTGTDLETSVTNLAQQMDRLQEEFVKKVKERQIYHAERIKHRILQLKNAVTAQAKLPKYIQGNTVIGMHEGNESYYKILITEENQLVRAPLKKIKRTLRKEVEEPDMSKQQPSETLDWLNPGLYLALKYHVPKKVRDIIDAQL